MYNKKRIVAIDGYLSVSLESARSFFTCHTKEFVSCCLADYLHLLSPQEVSVPVNRGI